MNHFRRDHCQRARRGMVLFEVMAALTIFAAVAFSLIVALDSAFDAELSRTQIDAAMQGLANQAAALHASPLIPGDKDLPDDGSGISYHLSVQPEQMQDQKGQPVGNMYRATITAKWTINGKDDERSFTELLYQP